MNLKTGQIICVENGVKRAKRSATKMHTSKKTEQQEQRMPRPTSDRSPSRPLSKGGRPILRKEWPRHEIRAKNCQPRKVHRQAAAHPAKGSNKAPLTCSSKESGKLDDGLLSPAPQGGKPVAAAWWHQEQHGQQRSQRG